MHAISIFTISELGSTHQVRHVSLGGPWHHRVLTSTFHLIILIFASFFFVMDVKKAAKPSIASIPACSSCVEAMPESKSPPSWWRTSILKTTRLGDLEINLQPLQTTRGVRPYQPLYQNTACRYLSDQRAAFALDGSGGPTR